MRSRFVIYSLVVALSVLVGVVVRWSSPTQEEPPGRAVDNVQATPVQSGPGVAAALAAPPPPEFVKEVLPELTEHVRDWRTFTPEALVVQLQPGLKVPFRVTQVQKDEHRTVLTARLDQDTQGDVILSGSFLVSTSNASDRWDALVVLPHMEYRVSVRSGSVHVEEAASSDLACLSEAIAAYGDDFSDGIDDGNLTAADTGAGGSPVIDVLFLYNSTALSERNNDVLAIDADCSNYIAACNAVLSNSRIAEFVWHYLGAAVTPDYEFSENLEGDLRAMLPNGSIGSFVRSAQASRGADQIVLLAGGVKKESVGVAWLGGTFAHSAVNYPFFTFSDGSRSRSIASFYTVCHELGHNFGCRHQRDREDSNAVDGDNQYHYGHVTPEGVGTIMANGTPNIAYFSHPEITFRGHPIGVAAGQPRAAYNARIIQENAVRIASLEERASGAPVIVEHPRSMTVLLDEAARFSVVASGGGLTYQWFRNGEPMTSVLGSSFTVTVREMASDSVQMTYTVTVANSFGSVTSQPAVLTVLRNPPPPPPPPSPPPSSSGGGGGGGSSGSLLVLPLLGLLALRWLGRIRRG